MNVYKTDDAALTLGDLKKGDLFEKDCNNPCTTYIVVDPDQSRNFCCEVIQAADKHRIVVDLKNSIVKALPSKTKVLLLEQTEGLGVREKS